MATSIAFAAKCAGYKGISLGGFLLGFNRDGAFQLYRWIGNGAATGFNEINSTHSIYIDADKLPLDMGGMTARFKFDDGVFVYGTTEMTFEVYSQNQSAAVYSVKRRPQVSGIIAGGMDSLGPLKRLRKSNCTGEFEAKAWGWDLFGIAGQLGFVLRNPSYPLGNNDLGAVADF